MEIQPRAGGFYRRIRDRLQTTGLTMQSNYNNLRGWLVAFLMAFATMAFAQAPAQPGNPPAAETKAAAPTPPPGPIVDKETVDNPYGVEAMWRTGDFVTKGTF